MNRRRFLRNAAGLLVPTMLAPAARAVGLITQSGPRRFASQGSAFFTDGFESGDLSHTENGASWLSTNGTVNVLASEPRTGTYAARFQFGTVESGDTSELRFGLGTPREEVWIRFYLKLPTNYAPQGTNDKLIRLGIGTEGVGELLMGSQLWPSDGYLGKLSMDVYEESIAELEMFETDRAIVAADLGVYREFVAQRVSNTLGSPTIRSRSGGNGKYKLYKEGECLCAIETIADQFDGESDMRTTWGYLLGAANGGFPETTDLRIDGVQFATSNIFGVTEHYRWGYTQPTTGSGDSASAAFCVGATGVTPNREGMTLKSIRAYCSNAVGRIAVYTGGTASSADGATLLVDGGADTADILQADVDVALPANTRIWIVIKLGSGVMGRQIGVSGFGGTSFDGVRTLTTELGSTTGTAFPASISGAGSAATWIPAAWLYHT